MEIFEPVLPLNDGCFHPAVFFLPLAFVGLAPISASWIGLAEWVRDFGVKCPEGQILFGIGKY